jgi:hypothetical protein
MKCLDLTFVVQTILIPDIHGLVQMNTGVLIPYYVRIRVLIKHFVQETKMSFVSTKHVQQMRVVMVFMTVFLMVKMNIGVLRELQDIH